MKLNNTGVIIIIFIAFCILLVLYNSKNNITNNKNTDSKERKSDIDDKKNIISDLFHSCPCGEGYVCDNEICKIKEGEQCLTNSSCSSNNFCFNGVCTVKPNISESYNINKKVVDFNSENPGVNKSDENLCTDRNPMLLIEKKNKFVLKEGWWILTDTISICDGEDKNEFYILNSKGQIYSINISESSLPEKIISNTDKIFIKLINLNGILYSLSYDGGIYKLINKNNYSFTWEILEKFYGINIINKIVEDINYSEGLILIKLISNSTTELMFTENINDKLIFFDELKFINGDKLKIENGDRVSLKRYEDTIYIIIKNEDLILYKIKDNNLYKLLKFNGIDVEFNPSTENNFYVLDNNNIIYNLIIEDEISKNLQLENGNFKTNSLENGNFKTNSLENGNFKTNSLENREKIIKKINNTYGYNILRTQNNIWITTKQQCLKI